MVPSPAQFRRLLLAWYERSGRHGLPWRKTWSPYHVFVSEFMLQQTTVATVLPYYDRFLKRFASFEKLAAAPLEQVLELWSGLGYYARARNLHAAAQMIVRDMGGKMPNTREGAEALPGVGRYTAGALLSFAYDKPEALVDGNVVRVLSRVYGVRGDVKDAKTLETLWGIGWKLVPSSGARHFNSALMDLGATVCRPASPDCLVCPMYRVCWARRHGLQEEIPRVTADRPRKEVHVHAALIERPDGKAPSRWALVQRPSEGLYGGLWEFPGAETEGKSASRPQVEKLFLALLGFPVRAERPLPSLKHVLSHRKMHIHPWLCSLKGSKDPVLKKGGWYTLAEIETMGISSLTRKVLGLLAPREKPPDRIQFLG